METQQSDYGLIGLGTMGRNLVYNMCDHGYSVSGFDQDFSKVDALEKEAGKYKVHGSRDVKDFIASLKEPRAIILLVPAGKVVDLVIDELKPLLSKQDLIMDWGNSHYTDTDRRIEALAKQNIHFMGIGISGGEAGARYGPSIMPGGEQGAYKRIAPMLEAVSAKINSDACVTYLGPGSSGHYVKMVHNGIEYTLMQVIAEAYNMLKELSGATNEELHYIFSKWNEGRLQSFLISITAEIFSKKDELSGNSLIDMVLDSAQQKGTGKWTAQNAMDMQVPIPSIDMAIEMRDLSAYKNERVAAQQVLKGPEGRQVSDKKKLVANLEQAVYFSMLTIYAQGFSMLARAINENKYSYNLYEVAKIWRGGCIIRAAVLETICAAYKQQPGLPNLMLQDTMANELLDSQEGLREAMKAAVEAGIPIPVMGASLAYFDSYRRAWLPSNLIQAQRDYFGAHTYQRTDREGIFHSNWSLKE